MHTLAEDTGLIVPIGRWVLHAACQAARDWQRRFPLQPHPFLSVNLSVRQLMLEITESWPSRSWTACSAGPRRRP